MEPTPPILAPGDAHHPPASSGPLIAVLVVSSLLGGALYVYLLTPEGGRSPATSPPVMVWYGLLLAVSALAAGWCLLGSEPWYVRVPVSGLMVALACLSADRFPVSLLIGTLFATVAAPLGVMRSLGVRLVWSDLASGGDLRRPQFTLKHISMWTVAAAVLLAGLLRLRDMEPQFEELCVYAVAFAVAPWTMLATTFSPKLRVGWLVIAALTSVVSMFAAGLLANGPPELLAIIAGTQFAVVATICLAARRAGLRWGN
jgi:hypothetical protein